MSGRKRHLLVDTQGFVLRVAVHAASVQDRDGARRVLGHLRDDFPAVSLVWADAAYRSEELNAWLEQESSCRLEIVARPPRTQWQRGGEAPQPQAAFIVLKRRWVVERTFAWMGRWRRLSKDYEQLPETSEALVWATLSQTMLRRLAKRSATPVCNRRKVA